MRLIPIPPGNIVKGSILFDGADVLKMDDDEVRAIRGNNIAMIFQDPMTSLNPVLTISRQITEALELHLKMDKAEARKRTVELLDLVGIPSAKKRMDDYPHQFSGGMRQRVMIAMALSCNPKLILADEPTTALDVTIQAQILELLKGLAREFRTGCILIPNAKSAHEARCWGTQQGGWLVNTDWRSEIGDTRILEEIKQEVAQLPPEPKPGEAPPPPTAM